MLDVKINHLRITMYKSDNLLNSDMFMIRIQALEWVQVRTLAMTVIIHLLES